MLSTLNTTQIADNFSQITYSFETKKDYKAYTNFTFLITESVLISQLLFKELSFNLIKNEIIEKDILQIRSQISRKGVLRSLRELLETIPQPYIEFLAHGNSDIRRYTLLLMTLRLNRILREVISELLIDRLQSLNPNLDRKIFKAFFEQKREQEPVLSQWSDSTYQKASSNTILILVRSGLLIPSKNKKTYEVQAMPLPFRLRQQLLLDGLESYVKLMLN
jgi:Putative inner membrane protein (DUF1819)